MLMKPWEIGSTSGVGYKAKVAPARYLKQDLKQAKVPPGIRRRTSW